MSEKVFATYDFEMDAMGLGDFVQGIVADLPDDEIHVYVYDEEGRGAKQARFVRETLTDGSTVVDLVIEFDRQLD